MSAYETSLADERARQGASTQLDHGHRIECLEQHLRDAANQLDQLGKQVVDLKKLIGEMEPK